MEMPGFHNLTQQVWFVQQHPLPPRLHTDTERCAVTVSTDSELLSVSFRSIRPSDKTS
jgi:hypothetical protein